MNLTETNNCLYFFWCCSIPQISLQILILSKTQAGVGDTDPIPIISANTPNAGGKSKIKVYVKKYKTSE